MNSDYKAFESQTKLNQLQQLNSKQGQMQRIRNNATSFQNLHLVTNYNFENSNGLQYLNANLNLYQKTQYLFKIKSSYLERMEKQVKPEWNQLRKSQTQVIQSLKLQDNKRYQTIYMDPIPDLYNSNKSSMQKEQQNNFINQFTAEESHSILMPELKKRNSCVPQNKQDILIIPIHSGDNEEPHQKQNEDVKLKDFLPYNSQGKFDIESDDSDSKIDDFRPLKVLNIQRFHNNNIQQTENSWSRKDESPNPSNLNDESNYQQRLDKNIRNYHEMFQKQQTEISQIKEGSLINKENESVNKSITDKFEQKIHNFKLKSKLINFTNKEFQNIKNWSHQEVSDLVYKRISKTRPFSTIMLPDRHLILPSLVFKHPLQIKGQSGTVLEISNGNIIFDFNDFLNEHFRGMAFSNHPDMQLVLSEINIVFKFDLGFLLQRLSNEFVMNLKKKEESIGKKSFVESSGKHQSKNVKMVLNTSNQLSDQESEYEKDELNEFQKTGNYNTNHGMIDGGLLNSIDKEDIEQFKFEALETGLLQTHSRVSAKIRSNHQTPKRVDKKQMSGKNLRFQSLQRGKSNQTDQVDSSSQYFTIKDGVITLPLLVIANKTNLAVNDCYFRSLRKDNQQIIQELQQGNASYQQFFQNVIQQNKQTGGSTIQNIQDQIPLYHYQVEEVGFWINGDCMGQGQLTSKQLKDKVENYTELRLCSSIFYNFYDQLRAGVNSKLLIEKCLFSESRNNAVYLVNPSVSTIKQNQFTRSKNNSIVCEWLKQSQWKEKLRKLIIDQNEISLSEGYGIKIQGFNKEFSAHNLDILIQRNLMKRNQKSAIDIQNLSVFKIKMLKNEILKNQKTSIVLKQVHQNSNKMKFTIDLCIVSDTNDGHAILVEDTHIHILNSKIEANSGDGVFVDSTNFPKPCRIIQDEVVHFIKVMPMKVIIENCEIQFNQKNGIRVLNFWKGAVEIFDNIIVRNMEYGVNLQNQAMPILQQDDLMVLARYSEPRLSQVFNRSQLNIENQIIKNKDQLRVPLQVSDTRRYTDGEYNSQTINLILQLQDEIVPSQVMLTNNMICEHTLGGIVAKNTILVVDYESVHLEKNGEYAISIPEEQMKKYLYLFLSSQYKDQLKSFKSEIEKKGIGLSKKISQVLFDDRQSYNHSKDKVVFGKVGGLWGDITPQYKKQGFFKSIFGKDNSGSNQIQQNQTQEAKKQSTTRCLPCIPCLFSSNKLKPNMTQIGMIPESQQSNIDDEEDEDDDIFRQ